MSLKSLFLAFGIAITSGAWMQNAAAEEIHLFVTRNDNSLNEKEVNYAEQNNSCLRFVRESLQNAYDYADIQDYVRMIGQYSPAQLDGEYYINENGRDEVFVSFTRELGEAGIGSFEVNNLVSVNSVIPAGNNDTLCPMVQREELKAYLHNVLVELTVRHIAQGDATRRLSPLNDLDLLGEAETDEDAIANEEAVNEELRGLGLELLDEEGPVTNIYFDNAPNAINQ